jgi:hypothetical protein
LATALQYRPDPASSDYSQASEGTDPAAFADEMGSYSKMGKSNPSMAMSTINAKSETDANKPAFRDPPEAPQVPDSSRCFLRVEKEWLIQAAVLLCSP